LFSRSLLPHGVACSRLDAAALRSVAAAAPPTLQSVVLDVATPRVLQATSDTALGELPAAAVDDHDVSDALAALAAACGRLSVLRVRGARELSRVTLESPSLRALELSGCSSLQSLHLQCPRLVELSMDALDAASGAAAAAGEAAAELPEANDAAVESLVNSMRQLAVGCPRLLRLHVAARTLSDAAVAALVDEAHATGKLRALSLTHAPLLSDASVTLISRTCPRLALLDLSGCVALTNKALDSLRCETERQPPDEVGAWHLIARCGAAGRGREHIPPLLY
jgi:hypothetical protein